MAILFLLDQWWMTELSVKDRYKTSFFSIQQPSLIQSSVNCILKSNFKALFSSIKMKLLNGFGQISILPNIEKEECIYHSFIVTFQ